MEKTETKTKKILLLLLLYKAINQLNQFWFLVVDQTTNILSNTKILLYSIYDLFPNDYSNSCVAQTTTKFLYFFHCLCQVEGWQRETLRIFFCSIINHTDYYLKIDIIDDDDDKDNQYIKQYLLK